MNLLRAYNLTDGTSRTGPGVNGLPYWNSSYDVSAGYLATGKMPPSYAMSFGQPPPPLPLPSPPLPYPAVSLPSPQITGAPSPSLKDPPPQPSSPLFSASSPFTPSESPASIPSQPPPLPDPLKLVATLSPTYLPRMTESDLPQGLSGLTTSDPTPHTLDVTSGASSSMGHICGLCVLSIASWTLACLLNTP